MARTDPISSERPPGARHARGWTLSWGRGRRSRETARRRVLRRVPVVVVVVALFLGLGAGTAFAYFSLLAAGTGNANVGNLQPLTVVPATAAVTGKLFPEGAGTLVITVTNPNPFAVTVVGITQAGPVTVTGGGTGCTSGTGSTPGTSGVAMAPTLNATHVVSFIVGAGPAITTTFTIATGATMSATSNTTCQGATFHIPVTLAVQRT